jgi:hypothetical protein
LLKNLNSTGLLLSLDGLADAVSLLVVVLLESELLFEFPQADTTRAQTIIIANMLISFLKTDPST